MDRYPVLTKTLHWLIAILVIGNLSLGWYLEGLDYYHPYFQNSLYYHRLIGVNLATLACSFWLCLILMSKPKLDEGLAGWEKKLATLNLTLMKILLVLVPVSGIALSTADGDAIPLVAGIEFPSLIDFSEQQEDFIQECHHISANLLASLAGLHILAVIKHQFIDRQNILRKML